MENKIKLLFVILLLTLNFAFAQDSFQKNLENYVTLHTARADSLISNRDKIIGVEVIITGRSRTLASSFGHALVRFVYKDTNSSDTTIVSFVARPEEEIFSTWKAATSKYSFIPEVMSLQEIWIKYYEKQNRDLTRYILNLSPAQLDQFLDAAFLYIQNPDILNGYNFFNNNCMVAVSKILIEAGLTTSTKQAIFPNNAHNWLRKNNLTNLPGISITRSDVIKLSH